MSGQRDEDIDYSDIPPIREIPANAVRGRFHRGHAIYLTDELQACFFAIALRRGVSLGSQTGPACLRTNSPIPDTSLSMRASVSRKR